MFIFWICTRPASPKNQKTLAFGCVSAVLPPQNDLDPHQKCYCLTLLDALARRWRMTLLGLAALAIYSNKLVHRRHGKLQFIFIRRRGEETSLSLVVDLVYPVVGSGPSLDQFSGTDLVNPANWWSLFASLYVVDYHFLVSCAVLSTSLLILWRKESNCSFLVLIASYTVREVNVFLEK